MKGIDKKFTSIQQITDQYLTQKHEVTADAGSQISFEEVLRQTQKSKQAQLPTQIQTQTNAQVNCAQQASDIRQLKFSKHASMRLENRNIRLSKEQNERLASGVKKAGEKGIQESLVIVDSLAFIVNIPNKTVVTALDKSEANENIFTNIDGAVII